MGKYQKGLSKETSGDMNVRIIGYCRVSTAHQNLELQIDAINQFAERKHIEEVVIYEEKTSSRKRRTNKILTSCVSTLKQ